MSRNDRSAVVVGARFGSWHAAERLDVVGQHRPHAVLPLQGPVDDQDGLTVGDVAVSLVDVRFDGHVDVAELVLEREKANALRCGWGLTGDDQAGYPNLIAARDRWHLVASQGVELIQAPAAEMDEVVTGGEV